MEIFAQDKECHFESPHGPNGWSMSDFAMCRMELTFINTIMKLGSPHGKTELIYETFYHMAPITSFRSQGGKQNGMGSLVNFDISLQHIWLNTNKQIAQMTTKHLAAVLISTYKVNPRCV